MLISLLHRYVAGRIHALGMRSRYSAIPGCRLHFYEYEHPSSPSSLLLLHGLGTSSNTWLYILPTLLKQHSVVALDLPGHGLSSLKGTETPWTFRKLLGAVHRFVESRVTTRFSLVGHSLGGWLGAKYATEHSEHVQRLVLINPAGILYEGVEDLREAFTIRNVRETRRILNRMWHRYPWYFRPFSRAVFGELRRRRVAEFVQQVEERDFLSDDLSRLTMPVFLIWGRNDRLIGFETVEKLRRRVPQVRVFVVDQCGHVPQLEQPQKTAAILKQVFAMDQKGPD